MKREAHRLVRTAIGVTGAVIVVLLLVRDPLLPAPPSPSGVSITVAPAAPVLSRASLFAEPTTDFVPARAPAAPPQLVGIVGRLSAPLVMLRANDGLVRSIGRGGTVDDWTLVDVTSDRATLRRGSDIRVSVLPPGNASQ